MGHCFFVSVLLRVRRKTAEVRTQNSPQSAAVPTMVLLVCVHVIVLLLLPFHAIGFLEQPSWPPNHALPVTNTVAWTTTTTTTTTTTANNRAYSRTPTFLRQAQAQASSSSKEEHNCQIMDGKAIAQTIREEIKQTIHDTLQQQQQQKSPPGLAVLLVRDRVDSQTYVRMKQKACDECGIFSAQFTFPTSVSQDALLQQIDSCNKDPNIHGILVQLPLPPHVDETLIVSAIAPEKDVDGLHPLNVAKLCNTPTHARSSSSTSTSTSSSLSLDWTDLSSIPFPIACTPQGCIELLDRYHVPIKGKKAVVIGRSNLVGLPVAMLLMHRDATVAIVHSQTVNAPSIVRCADIVICAMGRPRAVDKTWFQKGAVVVDVGINSVDDATSPKGYKLVGDVNYEQAKQVASLLTPVPGGVGPMTIAMLLRNTMNAWARTNQLNNDNNNKRGTTTSSLSTSWMGGSYKVNKDNTKDNEHSNSNSQQRWYL